MAKKPTIDEQLEEAVHARDLLWKSHIRPYLPNVDDIDSIEKIIAALADSFNAEPEEASNVKFIGMRVLDV